jgi:hypothetical protein
VFEDGGGGVPYIGFPLEEGEVLLEIFEHRIPLMKEQLEAYDRLSTLRAEQVETASRGWSLAEDALARCEETTTATATAVGAGSLVAAFEARFFWFTFGVVLGVGTVWLLR